MLEETRPRLLVNWEQEGARARHRESGLAALVLHLAFVIMMLISPRVFSGTPLAAELELLQPEVTTLYLPSDAVPIPEPQTSPDLTLEERRRAVIRPPLTLDPRELERILRPGPTPLTPPLAPLPPPGGPGQPAVPGGEQETRSSAAAQESESSGRQIARLEDLPEIERRSDSRFEVPRVSPGRAIQESLRRGQGMQGVPSIPPGGGGPGSIQPNFNTPFPTILSDTRGVDFTPYLIRLLREVRLNWYAVIPQSVRVLGEQGRVVIIFSIQKDGSVPRGQPTLAASSGRSHLDRPALAAIRTSQPFPPLPEEFDGPNIVLQFTFLYNLPLDYTGP